MGRLLANRLEMDFIDLDAFIEKKSGKSISAIFQGAGEAAFRKMESECLTGLLSARKTVISLGGGTVMNEKLFGEILNAGLVVFLDAPLETIRKNLQSSTGRPLLNNQDGNLKEDEALDDYITALYKKRRPVYEKANLHFQVPDENPEGCAWQMETLIKKHVEQASGTDNHQ